MRRFFGFCLWICWILALSGCQTTEGFLIRMGLQEPDFNPDEVTILVMNVEKTLPEYVAAIKGLQQRHLTIRNFQIKMEEVDKQIRASRNSAAEQKLLNYFKTVFKQRVQYQDQTSELLNKVYRSISKDNKKVKRTLATVRDAIKRERIDRSLVKKLSNQGTRLTSFSANLKKLAQMTRQVGNNFEQMYDYTLQYDNNHPAIYGQAYESSKDGL